jgi:hypothetical protein
MYDRLSEVIGRDNLFFDISNIEPGEDFVLRIREFVGNCDVLIVVIGPNWAAVQDASGKRRLDNPLDLVRIEVAAALQRNIRVIPILVDGALMPAEHQLPADLAALARRNAHDVSFAHFHTDLDSFIRVLQRILAGPSGVPLADTSGASKAEVRATTPVATQLPFTVSLTTVGNIATPLIGKGARLPAEASEVFSTAEDNQNSVEISLCLGERPLASDNVSIGKFHLVGIPPAKRGVPQITVTATVDTALILTVSAEDQVSKRKQVLDAVDLTRIEVPPDNGEKGAASIKAAESKRDSPVNLGADAPSEEKAPGGFGEFFRELFGTALDVNLKVTLTRAESVSGVEREFTLPNSRRVTVRIPANIQSGQRLRLRGEGNARQNGEPGDVYITVNVTDP